MSRERLYMFHASVKFAWHKKIEIKLTFHDAGDCAERFYLDPERWSHTMAQCMITHGRESFP